MTKRGGRPAHATVNPHEEKNDNVDEDSANGFLQSEVDSQESQRLDTADGRLTLREEPIGSGQP